MLKKGDLILSHSRGSPEFWNHLAIYVGDNKVINMENGKRENLFDFIERYSNYVVMRYKGDHEKEIRKGFVLEALQVIKWMWRFYMWVTRKPLPSKVYGIGRVLYQHFGKGKMDSTADIFNNPSFIIIDLRA